jgi:hypothetical protein
MKKYSAYLYILLTLLILAGCKGKDPSVKIDMKYVITPGSSRLSERIIYSDLLEEYRYIIPESTEESLFAYIYKAYIYRNSIFIFDKKNQDKILVFDLETGKFLRAIGSQGRAANEYVALGNFTLDKVRGNLLIIDEVEKKVLIYDADSGDFKRSFKLNFYPRNIEYVDENTIAYTGGGQNQDRLRLTDMDGREYGSFIPSDEKNWVIPINSFSRGNTGEVLFKTYLSDSVYTVTSNGPIVSRFVDFGNDALTWKKFASYSKDKRRNIEDYLDNYRANMKYYAETNSHIWFIFSDKNIPTCVIYNKKTGLSINYMMPSVNDIVFDKYAPLIVASDEDWFIGSNEAYSIVENIEQTSPTAVPKDLKNLSDNDNPVITLMKFKL